MREGAVDTSQLPIQTLGNEEAKDLIRDRVAHELKRFTASVENNPPSAASKRNEMVMDQAFELQNLKSETRYADEWINSAWMRLEAQAASQKLSITANETVILHLLRTLIEISNVKIGFLNHDYSHTHIDPAFSPQAPATHKYKRLNESKVHIEPDCVSLEVTRAARVPDSEVVADRLKLLAKAAGVRRYEVREVESP